MLGQEKVKFDVWREQLWSTYVRLESSSSASDFYGEVETAAPGSNLLSMVRSTGQLTERDRQHIKSDPQDLVLLAIQTSGHGFIEQAGRQACLSAGDLAIYDTSQPYKLYFDAPFNQLICRMPRNLVERRVPNFRHLTAQAIKGDSPSTRIAVGFIANLAREGANLGQDGLDNFTASIADMAANAIALSRNAADPDERLRLDRLKARMSRNLRSETPDLEKIAQQENISSRTLNRMFQATGTTPRKWILEQRLLGVAEDIRRGRLSDQGITELAFSWGFNDLSHFNRSFKTMFGNSPSKFGR